MYKKLAVLNVNALVRKPSLAYDRISYSLREFKNF